MEPTTQKDMGKGLVIGAIVVIILIVIGYFAFSKKAVSPTSTPVVDSTTTEEATPTNTDEPAGTPTSSTNGSASTGIPTVTTGGASGITSTGAMLDGRVNPNGDETTYWFEYNSSTLPGTLVSTGTTAQTLSSGSSTVGVKGTLTGLHPYTKYYYRLVAKNQNGTTIGSASSFVTKR
jgi:phosphodiesterase/alkaline phosphatase D-like protein